MLDENVRVELARFLKIKKFDVKLLPKSSGDALIAKTSLVEKRIVISNDEDFSRYARDEIFSIVWLRIPQNDPSSLIKSFKKLLEEFQDFEAKLVLLKPDDWDDFPLAERFFFDNPDK